jgi:hypothetical protein
MIEGGKRSSAWSCSILNSEMMEKKMKVHVFWWRKWMDRSRKCMDMLMDDFEVLGDGTTYRA